jgi:hypothetical protein
MHCRPIIYLVLLWLSGKELAVAQAPLPNNYLFKVDPLAALAGEYRFSAEKRLTNTLFASAGLGWVQRTNTEGSLQPDDCPDGFGWYCGFANYQWLWHASARAAFGHPDSFAETVQGPVLRPGLRFYLPARTSPAGWFLHLDLSYGFWWGRFQTPDRTPTATFYLHRPGVRLLLGKQWLVGHHRNLSVNWFAGAENTFYLGADQPAAGYTSGLAWDLAAQLGLELGFAFRKKHRHN